MKEFRTRCSAALAAALLTACASTDSRIHDNQAAFDGYPPPVQQQIRAGQVDIGFTPEMVRMALGEPDRRFSRSSATGDSEVWAYRDSKPMFSFGVGAGSFGGGGFGGGGGVGLSTGGDQADDKLRLVFVNGAVASIEKNLKQ